VCVVLTASAYPAIKLKHLASSIVASAVDGALLAARADSYARKNPPDARKSGAHPPANLLTLWKPEQFDYG
jgi:hypothetical protein